MNEVQKMVLVPYEKYSRSFEKQDTLQADVKDHDGRKLDIQVGNGLPMDIVLTSIPRQYTHKVKAILLHIVDDPRKILGWNDQGELQYRGETIPASHTVDLLKDSQYEYRGLTPQGMTKFYEGLREINIPKSLIGNENRRHELIEGQHPPGIPAKEDKRPKRSADWKTYLSSIYYDPKHPASYSGPSKLYRVVKSEGKHKIGSYRIRKWLQDQDAYSLTRGARRRFPRSRVVVEGMDSQWDADLMDMSNISKDNDGIRYVLVAIDIFSRYLWCRVLKNKTGVEVVNAMTSVLSEGRKPKVLRTDKGSEFTNRVMTKYLKDVNVNHLVTQNETKANYAERVIKTLKHKIFRYVLKTRTYRYVDVLQELVKSYNETFHRSLGVTPSSITKDNEGESRLQQYLLRQKRPVSKKKKKSRGRKYKYKLGEIVRISHVRGVFDREYSQKWTGELFRVTKRYMRQGLPVYKLKDWSGEDIEGTFYTAELQPVHVDDNTSFTIEKILKRRTRRGQREALVHWLHWPKKYDSWIPESDIQDYKRQA